MKTPFYSLRTGILANLTFLIIAAMLLINAVVIKLTENDLIKARVKTGEILAKSLAHTIAIEAFNKKWEKIDLQ